MRKLHRRVNDRALIYSRTARGSDLHSWGKYRGTKANKNIEPPDARVILVSNRYDHSQYEDHPPTNRALLDKLVLSTERQIMVIAVEDRYDISLVVDDQPIQHSLSMNRFCFHHNISWFLL